MDSSVNKQASDNDANAFDEIDSLNEKAWAEKYTDVRASKDAAYHALNWAQEVGYKKGQAYALRTIGACRWLLAEYELGIKDTEQSLCLFEELNDSFGLAHALNVLGNINEKKGEYAQALDFFTKSLAIREEIGDYQGAATSLNNIGNVYFSFGRLADALDCYLKSLSFHEEVKDLMGVSRSLNNVGNIYGRLGEHNKALEALTRSFEIKREIGDKLNVGKVLLNMGDAYVSRGSLGRALEFYTQSLESSRESGDRITQTTALGSIGQLYQKLGDYEKAFDFHVNQLESAKEIGVRFNEVEALINLGSVHTKRKEFDEAFKCLDQALMITDELRANELTQRIHKTLSEAYEAKGDFILALHHHKLFHQTFRRVFGEETEQKVKSLSVQFEIEKAQNEAEIHRLRNVELAQANEALLLANRFKTELLHIAAHDLKNPLQSILGFSDLIMNEVAPESDIHEMSKDIYDSSQRMFELIKAILEEAELESGQLELDKKHASIEVIARQAVNQNQSQASLKGQKILFSSDTGCFAFVDPKRLLEAFDNLISNAVKYSPKDATIKVNVKHEKAHVRFEVKDEGPGLTDEDKRKLFQKFQRLSASPTGGETSTRLGLSITKLLVENHNGTIRAESELGKGSTFIIEIPVFTVKDGSNEIEAEDLDKTII